MKRLLTLALLLCGFMQVWAQDDEEENSAVVGSWTDDKGVVWSFLEFYGLGVFISNCSKKTGDVVIPSTIYYKDTPYDISGIAECAFEGCSGMTSVTFPESLKRIIISAFKNCTGLTSVKLPEGFKVIEEGAFRGCSNLRTLTLPSSIEIISQQAFYGCTRLSTIYCYRKDANLFENQRQTSDFDNPFENTFSRFNATLYVPYGCTDAYKKAYGWKNFKTILEIPSTGPLITIDGITYNIANNKAYVAPGEEPYTGDIIIPAEISYDGTTYPVRNINSRAFMGCTGITGVTFPEGLTTIGQYAFDGCTGLTSVIIPEGVTTIGNAAFQGCTGLTTIVIPSTVTSINNHAFDGCNHLTTVYSYMKTPPTISPYAFSNRKNAILYVPYGRAGVYGKANYWKQFKEIIEMESPTGISTVNTGQSNADTHWFTLEGFKLNSQPVQKGIYIRNGKKVVIK